MHAVPRVPVLSDHAGSGSRPYAGLFPLCPSAPARPSQAAKVEGRHSEHPDGDLACRMGSGMASQARLPREARVGTLRPRKDHVRGGGQRSSRWRRDRETHFDPLVAHQLQTGAPVFPATPISPQQRRGTHRERMEQEADPTRLCRGVPVPLTLRTLWALATIADAGAGEETQTAISFPALLGRAQRLALWAAQHAIRLEGKVLPREAPCASCAERQRVRHSPALVLALLLVLDHQPGQAQTRSCASAAA